MGYAYNDLRVGDTSVVLRNVLNAGGFTSFAAGALSVADRGAMDGQAMRWFCVIGLIIFTTVHAQDLADRVGDEAAGRRTIPIVLGHERSRWTIAVPVLLWSFVCPWYWGVGRVGAGLVGVMGGVVVLRLLLARSIASDKMTFFVYNVWLVAIYALPLCAAWGSGRYFL